ncbi:MAG: GAF domain-containing protein [Candidatus Sulfotelmatobacter sp.]
MAANISTLPPALSNRRRRVRHKVQTPAYVSFTAESKGLMLDLHEIVDISEDGVAIQCHAPLEVEKRVNLCLDLADCSEHIYTTGQVIWANDSGRAGLRFAELPAASLARLREWLFVNVMSGVANGEAEIAAFAAARDAGPPRPSYSDTLAAVSAVQRQVEALGSDLPAALKLIAERAQTLLRASGAAIALAESEPNLMVCHATSGPDAPPVGARLQVGSGFSGECVKSGLLLRCDDTELDPRVDRESCRALGIRSILAAPVRAGGKSIGLIEIFSPHPNAFSDADGKGLQRFAEFVQAAAHRDARANKLSWLDEDAPDHFSPQPGSVLFAAAEQKEKGEDAKSPHHSAIGINLPRSHLVLLLCSAATITFALGWGLAPWIQSEAAPWIQRKLHGRENVSTVLASNAAPKSDGGSATRSTPAIASVSFDQVRQMAEKGDPAAQNALGLRYAIGDGVKLNEVEAVRWFNRAARQGNVSAQSKLGSLYYSGRGLPQDINRAYFWMVVASNGGDDASHALAPLVKARLSRAQVTSIEMEAGLWMQQHRPHAKPAAGRFKALSAPSPVAVAR